jgi:hypothetical protein
MENNDFITGKGKDLSVLCTVFMQTKKGAVNLSHFQAELNICHNALALYFRQIVIMPVSLYIVRMAPAAPGAEDYGIYNNVFWQSKRPRRGCFGEKIPSLSTKQPALRTDTN